MAFKHSQENQLLFHLDGSTLPTNQAVKFHRPVPIVIEKCGPSTTPPRPSPAFRFSSVSEQQLSSAIQLAKRDLRKQRQQEELERSQGAQRSKGKSAKKGKAQIVHSKEYKDRLKKRQERDKNDKVIVLKEREKGKSARNSSVQTQRQRQETTPQKRPVLHVRQDLGYLPATSHSPPTRDTDPWQRNAPKTQDEKSLQEIQKLRDDINDCLIRIRDAEQTAKQDFAHQPQKKPMYAEDIEDAKKKAMRSEEHTTRLARTLFTLNQQVKEIQEELSRVSDGQIKPNKKTQLLSRLAATHRGTLRAFQSLIQQLPDYKLYNGMPRTYHELIFLIRQLSLCCAQLEVAGETGVPPSVLNLLKDVNEFNQTIDQELHTSLHRSPPRLCHTGKVTQPKHKSPISRQLFAETVAPPGEREGHRQLERENRPPAFSHEVRPSKQTVDRLQRDTQDKAVDATPERNAALRAGISALLRAGQEPVTPRSNRTPRKPTKPAGVPPLNLPMTPRTPRSRVAREPARAWDVPLDVYQERRGKGLLLPSGLQAKRQRHPNRQQPLPPPPGGDAHYAEPTLSSRRKEVDSEDWPQPSSPQTPRHRQAQSPRRQRARSLSPPSSPLHVAKRDIERQVWFDREAVRRMKEIEAGKTAERQKIAQMKRAQGQTYGWSSDAAITTKIKPLLEKAEMELNADMVADMMLEEMLEDAARQVGGMEKDDLIHNEAAAMQDGSTLENLIQRMHEMEDEQNEIRRRYATIVYEDERSHRTARSAFIDAPYSEQPVTPPPIEVTSLTLNNQGRDLLPDPNQGTRGQTSEVDAILFTNPQPATLRDESLHLSHPPYSHPIPQGSAAAVPARVTRTPLYLSKQVTDNIHRNRHRFETFLKKSCNASVGKFNPWVIVEEISDEILAECVYDVGKELDDINNDIINHVYQSEFTGLPGGTAEPPSGESQDQHETEST